MNTSQVCNGVPDCPWGEDELVCGELSQGLGTAKGVRRDKSHGKKFLRKMWGVDKNMQFICLFLV